MKKLLPLCLAMSMVFTAGAQAQALTGTLKKIKDSGTIVVGNRDSSIPFSYLITGSSGALSSVGGAFTRVDDALGKLNASAGVNATNIASLDTQISAFNGALADAVLYDSSAHTSVTLGNTGTPVRLKNVAAGSSSTDAVNLGQLATTAQNAATALGGGAAGNSNGTITAPSYTLTNANTITSSSGALNNVGGAFTRVDNALGKLNTSTSQNTTSIGGINTQITTINGKLADAVLYDSAAHATVTLGNAGTPVKLKNVAAGTASTDAINLGQLASTAQNAATALGGGSTGSATGAITAPSYTLTNANTITNTTGAQNNVGGAFTRVDDALGKLNTSASQNASSITTINNTLADAVLYDSSAHTTVTLGNAGTPVKLKNVAAGTTSTDAVNLGQLASTAQNAATALGGGATGSATGAITAPSYTLTNANTITNTTGAQNNVGGAFTRVDDALGKLNTSTSQNTTSIGGINTQITTINGKLADAVLYDSAAHATVTLGNAGTPVKLKNVAAGTASTDAVNLGQLASTAQNAATALGGGATGSATGAITAPSYTLTNANTITSTSGAQSNVGGAFTRVDDALGKLNTSTSQNTTSIGGINTQITTINGKLADAVLYDSAAHTSVTLGNAGTPVRVTNVAAGALNANSTDAVNGSQLFATNQQISSINGSIADAVLYDSAAHTSVTLGNAGTPVRVTNVAAGALNANSTDAVNGSQLFTTNENVSDLSTQITTISGTMADAVLYDSAAHTSVTLGNAGTPVTVTNVAAGALNANSTDAVNGSQLFTTNENVSSLNTQITTISGTLADAVLYDSAAHTSITLGNAGTPVTVTNVAAGALNANSTDAVNGSQLYATNQQISTINGTMADAVLYDSAAHTSVTLGNAGTPVTVTNVAAGALNANSTDAVNGSQLFTTNENVSSLNTQITTISGTLADAVLYDSAAHTSVTLGNAGTPVTVTNVAAGALNANSTDAVNGSQLFATNQQISTINGTLTDAVLYDSAAHTSVTLGNAGTPVTVTNVAAGALNANSTDAVNGSQLFTTNENVSDLGTQITSISGTLADAVMYDSAAHTSITLGNAGTPVTVTNVAAGALNANSTDAVNGSQLFTTNENVSSLSTQITSINGTMADAVLYDSSAHTSVTLGNAGTPVTVTNVAAGALNANSTDAVNGSQLFTTNENVSSLSTQISSISGTMADAVMYDSSAHNTVTLGNAGTPVTVTNVAAGALNANSTDAVNGAQLYATNQSVAQNTSDISSIVNGGGVKYFHANSALADSQATAADSVAIGGNAQATAVNSVALGSNSTTTADLTQAAYNPGTGAIAGLTPVGEVSVGSAGAERRITNVAAGSADTDAVNVSQLRQVTSASVADALLYDSPAHGVVTLGGSGSTTPVRLRNVAAGVAGTDAVNMSQLTSLQSVVNHIDGQVLNIINNGGGGGSGNLPYVSGNANGDVPNAANSGNTAGVAVGYNSSASGENSSVLGQNAEAGGKYGVAIGNDSYAAGRHDTAIGGNAKVHADGSLAAGSNATVSAEATNAVAVGADASVTAASATAIGQGASATAANSVALGKGSVASRENAVSVGTAGNERQITNVAPGVESTDAVNMSQLQGVASQSNAYTDQQVNSTRKQASAGTAAAIAVANLPQPYEANKSMVSVAVGGFDGESGYALGVSHATPSGWVFRAAATGNSRSKYGGGIGAGFQW